MSLTSHQLHFMIRRLPLGQRPSRSGAERHRVDRCAVAGQPWLAAAWGVGVGSVTSHSRTVEVDAATGPGRVPRFGLNASRGPRCPIWSVKAASETLAL